MIDKFSGEHEFLSNFYPTPVKYEGAVYPSVEHAFQAAKTLDPQDRAAIARTKFPGQAKRMGKTVVLRKNWEHQKVNVMLELLRQKFSQPDLGKMLLDTGDQRLVEGNGWHDNFWGRCRCDKCPKGQNVLGRMLMKVRSELRAKETPVWAKGGRL